MFAIAPLAKEFNDDPRIVAMLRVMALTFIINAIGNTHDGLMQKELDFRRRYIPNLISSVVKGVISIALALTGFGVWSLVAGVIVSSVVRTAAKWWFYRWLPGIGFYIGRARGFVELWR